MHLVVVSGGIFGYPYFLTAFATLLLSSLGSNYTVHVSQSNSLLDSLYGIDAGGHNLAREIKEQYKLCNATELSVIGLSLGGLYSKFAVQELYHYNQVNTEFYQSVRPRHFITVGTPHYGIPSPSALKQFLVVSLNLLGRTGQQLLHSTLPEQSIILDLIHNTTGLRNFQSHTSFCGMNDWRVPYGSCAMTCGCLDDFVDIDWHVVQIHYDEGFLEDMLTHTYITMNQFFIDKWIPILEQIVHLVQQ